MLSIQQSTLNTLNVVINTLTTVNCKPLTTDNWTLCHSLTLPSLPANVRSFYGYKMKALNTNARVIKYTENLQSDFS